MLESCNNATERLYLEKDPSGDISVPCSKLAQHQIDGLRFLFSQYKKKKLGVILNYPPGCGSSVQVVIFISAIFEKLKKPVLILYNNEVEKQAWLERFANWTIISADSIEVDTSNQFARKQIFLENIVNVSQFYRRLWGIVVVKSDSFLKTFFQKCQLQVDYKIWITAQDLKQNKELLQSVYSWINPSDKLLNAYFTRESPSIFQEDGNKEILLDLLLEDFLITRRGLNPFGAIKRRLDLELPVPRVSKKNKDVTGKKIKRSKKYQEEASSASTIRIESVTSLRDSDDSFESSNLFSKTSNVNNETNSSANNLSRKDNDDEESKMDVESFIRDNDPLKSDSILSFAINNLDNTSQPSGTNSPKAEEICTESSLNFASAIADIITVENNDAAEISDDSVNFNAVVSKSVCELTEKITEKDVEANNSPDFNKIDFSKPVIQKIFFSSQNTDHENELNGQEEIEDKTEKKLMEEETNGNGTADQTDKLEVSTSVMNETDSSFDSKMKEFEEKALRKFKGSFLDNIF